MTQINEKPIGELSDGETVTSHFFNECPFCGETTIYLTTGKDGCMNCPNCLVRMPNECNDHIELVHCWNTRAPRTISRDELAQALHAFLIALKDTAFFHTDIAIKELNNPIKKAIATLGITVEGE